MWHACLPFSLKQHSVLLDEISLNMAKNLLHFDCIDCTVRPWHDSRNSTVLGKSAKGSTETKELVGSGQTNHIMIPKWPNISPDNNQQEKLVLQKWMHGAHHYKKPCSKYITYNSWINVCRINAHTLGFPGIKTRCIEHITSVSRIMSESM